MSRLSLAFKSFFSLLFGGKLPEDVIIALGLTRRVAAAPAPRPPAAAKEAPRAPEPSRAADGAIQILALLQQEARLVDFLLEDIGAYTDEQVGAAVRDVHRQSRDVLTRHFKLVPVVDGVEGTTTRLATVGLSANDTARVRLLGNLPPDGNVESGILRHRGWRAETVNLPPLKGGERASIVAPAEIEVE